MGLGAELKNDLYSFNFFGPFETGKEKLNRKSEFQNELQTSIPHIYHRHHGGCPCKNSTRCNFFQIERKKLHISHCLGVFVVIFGCLAFVWCRNLGLKILPV